MHSIIGMFWLVINSYRNGTKNIKKGQTFDKNAYG